ncbi:putative serine/threonine-protein kinase iks1 [Cryptotrichosporon argae]
MASSPNSATWTPIGQTTNQLVLYHPPSHALQVLAHSGQYAGPSRPRPQLLLSYEAPAPSICRTCGQLVPILSLEQDADALDPVPFLDRSNHSVYFQTLARAHEGSRPSTPRRRLSTPSADELDEAILEGYYQRYFREERRLGFGAEGSVFLAVHTIDGNELGTYAVKKVAVGKSRSYLVRMLQEVKLLEQLRHPNVIAYHHSWLDRTRFSSFGPPVIALHVLMTYANAGNLDVYLATRSHAARAGEKDGDDGGLDSESFREMSQKDRIARLKKRRKSGAAAWRDENRAVLLLDSEEILLLFSDVVEGLAFLHSNGVLHLDLKCSNVLLHWEEGRLVPKAQIADFGTSEQMLRQARIRTGHTGTMEYMAPETLVVNDQGNWRPSDSHADVWSLGIILHKLLFLHLPYSQLDDLTRLHAEIVAYPGFVPTSEQVRSTQLRSIPADVLAVAQRLLDVYPDKRPSAEQVRAVLVRLRPKAEAAKKRQASNTRQSPKRSLLALSFLPPPTPEPQTLLPVDVDMYNPPQAIQWVRLTRALLFCAKIASLQPQLTGLHVPMIAVVVLLTLAVSEIMVEGDDYRSPLAAAMLHLAVYTACVRSAL